MSTLDEIQRLLDTATPGPWKTCGSVVTNVEGDDFIYVDSPEHPVARLAHRNEQQDAALIAALRNAAPDLLRIARAVAEQAPDEWVEISYSQGFAQCRFCDAHVSRDGHAADCAWLLARRMRGET